MTVSYRKFKWLQRRRVGVNANEIKKTQSTIAATAPATSLEVKPMATRHLYGCDVTNISMKTGFSNQDFRRESPYIFFKGVSYHFTLRNLNDAPIVFNYALISFKNRAMFLLTELRLQRNRTVYQLLLAMVSFGFTAVVQTKMPTIHIALSYGTGALYPQINTTSICINVLH